MRSPWLEQQQGGVVGQLALAHLLVGQQGPDDAAHGLGGRQATGEVAADQVDEAFGAEEVAVGGAGLGDADRPLVAAAVTCRRCSADSLDGRPPTRSIETLAELDAARAAGATHAQGCPLGRPARRDDRTGDPSGTPAHSASPQTDRTHVKLLAKSTFPLPL